MRGRTATSDGCRARGAAGRRPITAVALALALALACAGASAAPATAARSYCSVTGDVCYGVVGSAAPVRLGITLAAKYFRSYRLCITGPDGVRDCRRFRVRARPHGVYGSTVRWARHFPNRGHGRYRARWRSGGNALGPAISFRRSG